MMIEVSQVQFRGPGIQHSGSDSYLTLQCIPCLEHATTPKRHGAIAFVHCYNMLPPKVPMYPDGLQKDAGYYATPPKMQLICTRSTGNALLHSLGLCPQVLGGKQNCLGAAGGKASCRSSWQNVESAMLSTNGVLWQVAGSGKPAAQLAPPHGPGGPTRSLRH